MLSFRSFEMKNEEIAKVMLEWSNFELLMIG